MPIDDSDAGYEACECNGKNCGEMVEEGEPFFSTFCGTFCTTCMKDHMRECEICRKEFS